MKCDISGKEGAKYQVMVEGAKLTVRKEYTHLGEVVGTIAPEPKQRMKSSTQDAPMQLIVEDFAQQIKRTREKHKLTQEEFAKKLNEKASTMHQVESGHMKPSQNIIDKLRKSFGLKLVEEASEEDAEIPIAEESSELTLGDFIKIKKKP